MILTLLLSSTLITFLLTRGVDTDIVTAPVVLSAFVDVLARQTPVSLAVTQVTDTLVGAHHVLTGSVTADSTGV